MLSAKTVLRLVRKNNPSLRSSSYDVAIAELERKNALVRPLPTLTGNATISYLSEAPTVPTFSFVAESIPGGSVLSKISDILAPSLPQEEQQIGPRTPWSAGVSVTVPLFAGGKLLNGYRRARGELAAAHRNHRRKSDEVSLEVLRLFWEFVGRREQTRSLQEEVRWYEQLVEDQKAMHQAGLLIKEDILKAKTGLSWTKLKRLREQNALADLEQRILLSCGLSPDTQVELEADALEALDEGTKLESLDIDSVVSSRPDIQAMDFRLSALRAARKALAGAYLPDIAGLGKFELNNTSDFAPYTSGNNTDFNWTVGARLQWNLFDWGAGIREIRKADARIEQLKLAIGARKDAAAAEIAALRRKIGEARQAEELANQTKENAECVLAGDELRYREGVITSTELLDTRRELTQARQQIIQAKIEKALSVASYKVATAQRLLEN